MQSNCGVTVCCDSGHFRSTMWKAGLLGLLGAAELGKLIGGAHILALDIRGNNGKCSLIEAGEVKDH
jgi:hypothetical protein